MLSDKNINRLWHSFASEILYLFCHCVNLCESVLILKYHMSNEPMAACWQQRTCSRQWPQRRCRRDLVVGGIMSCCSSVTPSVNCCNTWKKTGQGIHCPFSVQPFIITNMKKHLKIEPHNLIYDLCFPQVWCTHSYSWVFITSCLSDLVYGMLITKSLNNWK